MIAVGSLLLVGCGKMGGALLSGWLDQGLAPEAVTVVEPYPAAMGDLVGKDPHRGRIQVVASAADLPADLAPDMVVFAVKPQMMDAALPSCRRFVRPDCVFLSIAAGKTIAYFEDHLGAEARVVRAMPNTPAAVGRGMTVLSANAGVTADQRAVCEELLATVGETAWVADEGLIDAVTAVSGGGPAYVFLLIECLAEAGAAAGLPPELAQRLARVTVAGAGELVHLSGRTGQPTAPERHLAGRHHPGSLERPDGRGRPSAAHDQGHRGGDPPLARTRRIAQAMVERNQATRTCTNRGVCHDPPRRERRPRWRVNAAEDGRP